MSLPSQRRSANWGPRQFRAGERSETDSEIVRGAKTKTQRCRVVLSQPPNRCAPKRASIWTGGPPKKIRPSGFRSPQRPVFEWGAKPRIPDQPFGRGQPLPQQSRKRLENGLVSPRDTRMFSIDANAATDGGSRGKHGITVRSPPAGRKGLPATGGMRGCREKSDEGEPLGESVPSAPRRRGISHEGTAHRFLNASDVSRRDTGTCSEEGVSQPLAHPLPVSHAEIRLFLHQADGKYCAISAKADSTRSRKVSSSARTSR